MHSFISQKNIYLNGKCPKNKNENTFKKKKCNSIVFYN